GGGRGRLHRQRGGRPADRGRPHGHGGRQPVQGPRLGRPAEGDVRRGRRPRRPGADGGGGRRVRRRPALRRPVAGRRVGRRAGPLLPHQRGRHAEPARRHPGGGRGAAGVLVHGCHLRGPDEVPIVETAATVPTNPYGASKLAVDLAIGFECAAAPGRGQTFGATSLRYFNVAGASGDYGELHDPETHLIPLVLRVAAGLRDSVQIYGTDYPTDDGTAVRDYIHVEDLARAHLLALEAITPGRHAIYNLGNGQGFSVRQVVEACRAVTGHPIPAVEVGRRAGDPAVLVASSDKIRRDLGWVPEKPSLEAMVGDAWRWIQANAHRHG